MTEVRLRSAAAADLEELLTFSRERFGAKIAGDYAAGLGNALDLMARHPHVGQIQRGFAPQVRCFTFRKHRIFYDVEEETVWIIRILHHARDAKRHLK